jgi:acetyl-CoA synthetase
LESGRLEQDNELIYGKFMIKARIKPENPAANLKSYFETYRNFSWSEVEKEFPLMANGGLNIVYYAIDRWADDPEKQNNPALIYENDGKTDVYSYRDLKEISCCWANLLVRHGFKKGDRLFIFLPPTPEIYFAMLACARIGIIFSCLYTTLSFEELQWRLHNAQPLGVLTNTDLVERLSPDAMKGVQSVFLISGDPPGVFPWEIVVEGLLDKVSKEFEAVVLPPETPLYLLYSSGSTGPPKGVIHAHQDMLGHLITARYVLDLTENSVLWTDCEPAWVTGTVYGMFAPWLTGAASVVQGESFSASTWYRTLETHHVTVWYTTPLTVRRLKAAGADLPGRYDFSSLRHIATVGETLVPELFYWVKENLKHSPHDTWWMTETGMICIANFPSEPIKPGSMGKPVPGVEVAVIDSSGNPMALLTLGQLALKVGWPTMMKAIWRDKLRYSQYFLKDWFLTGDMVIMDEDGYYYHQGRNDDLIKAGQEFIGPYEIEGVLRLHPAVGEAAVISKAVSTGTPSVKAFVTINKGFTPSARLNHELKAFVRTNLHSQILLAEIAFLDELPKTISGKLLRRVLRARELGLPSGDTLKLRG